MHDAAAAANQDEHVQGSHDHISSHPGGAPVCTLLHTLLGSGCHQHCRGCQRQPGAQQHLPETHKQHTMTTLSAGMRMSRGVQLHTLGAIN
jgi:hypothetical protein